MRVYSPFFQTLYDQPEPVGSLGRGVHYSVLRCITWKDQVGKGLYPAGLQTFGVIWDEDHDVRVIPAIEELYRKDMLHGILFVGEAKGNLHVIVAKKFRASLTDAQFGIYGEAVEQLAQGQPDPWCSFVAVRNDRSVLTMIQDKPERGDAFLDNIDVLWGLGCKPYQQPVSPAV